MSPAQYQPDPRVSTLNAHFKPTAASSSQIGVTVLSQNTPNLAPETTPLKEKPNSLTNFRHQLLRLYRTQAILTATLLLALMLVFSVLFPTNFPTAFNFEHLLVDYSSIVILSAGLTFAMTSGQFDLSIGGVLVFSGVVSVQVMQWVGGNNWFTLVAGLIAGVGVGCTAGLFNGWCIVKARIPSIIVTLGTAAIAQGLAYIISGGRDLTGIPQLLSDTLGFGKLFDIIPYTVILAVLVVAIGATTLSMTRFGRYTAAVGSNIEAARRAGVNVSWVVIRIYLISGGVSGLAGYMSLSRFNSTTLAGHGQDSLTALLGVVLGGTSLFGGSGTVIGSGIGVFIPGVLSNGLILGDIIPYWQFVIVGLVLIGVVYVDLIRRRSR